MTKKPYYKYVGFYFFENESLTFLYRTQLYYICFTSCILITGDGDFGCLVEFLKENNAISGVIAPDENKCSILIRNKNIEITFLNDIYHKFSNRT